MSEGSPNLSIEKQLAKIAGALWCIAMVATALLVARSPITHNDCGIYMGASEQWWAGLGLYMHNRGIDGFLYLPQFALVYSPFALLGYPIGDIAWRALGLSLLVTGLWRACARISRRRYPFLFFLCTLATLPPSLASLRNGQANLFVAGMMLHGAVEIRDRRWWHASLWLMGGVIVKPIMIVMALLSAAVYRPLILRVVACAILIAVMPFAFQKPAYVVAQFHAYVGVLNVSSDPPDLYCNIRGLLGKMGWVMSRPIFNTIAASAAAATLGLCLLLAKRRWNEPMRVFFILAFSACYLMLFNPRTESNSYIVLAPVLAIPAAVLITMARARAAAALYVLSFMLICDGWAYKLTENWLKPLTALVVWILFIHLVTKGGDSISQPSEPAKEPSPDALAVESA